MKPYIAQIASNLRLMGRDRAVLVYSYMFPLVFFFVFAQTFHAAANPAAMAQTIAMVLIIGVLGNGFFGAGIRTVLDRETNVLRRFKVAPISAGPIIVASMVSGLVAYLPTVFLFLICGRIIYHAPIPVNLISLLIFISIGLLTFRAMGMIIAAVVNSQQEATILIQLLYLPMLFLSGATFPTSIMPQWVQNIAHFLPATYLFEGLRSIMIGGETAFTKANLKSATALLVAMGVALFVGIKLFRWEKEEKIAGKAKLWILVVMAPFFIDGVYQAYSQQNVEREKMLDREASRMRSILFQDVKIFIGDGKTIERGAVLIRSGKIAEVFDSPPDPKSFSADVIDEQGKTMIPGLIDMRVHIGAPGGVYKDPQKGFDPTAEARRLAAYLYSGVTAVRDTRDTLDTDLILSRTIASGKYLGARFYTCPDCPKTNTIEPAPTVDLIPMETFVAMKNQQVPYDPTLSVYHALAAVRLGTLEPLNQPLLQQVAPVDLLSGTRAAFAKPKPGADPAEMDALLNRLNQNLLHAYQAGVTLITGSDAGNLLVIHGPTVQRELELWVSAGIPTAVALQAATYNPAKVLHADDQFGLIHKNLDATFVILDGDPLHDISATEHINSVYLRGEHIDRSDLFEQFKQ